MAEHCKYEHIMTPSIKLFGIRRANERKDVKVFFSFSSLSLFLGRTKIKMWKKENKEEKINTHQNHYQHIKDHKRMKT